MKQVQTADNKKYKQYFKCRTISAGPKNLQQVVFGTVEAAECDHLGVVAN